MKAEADRIVIRLIACAAVLTTVLVGCAREEHATKLGAALPLTGDGAVYGSNARMAIDLAVEEANKAGGINGRPIVVVYENTRMTPSEAVSAVTKLSTVDRVPVVIGPMASSEVQAVLPVCDRHGTVIVSPSATDHGLTGKSPNFFRTIASDVYEGQVTASFAYERMGYRHIAIIYVESAGPFGVAEEFRMAFKGLGGTVTGIEKASQGATDLRSQLTRISASRPDAMFFAGFATETGVFLKQRHELAVTLPVLAHQTAEAPEVREIAGSAAEGVVFASGTLDPATGGRSVQAFNAAFRARYGKDPENYAPNSYDAAKLVLEAIKRYGYSAEGIRRGLHEVSGYEGAAGTLTVLENGDVEQPMRVLTIRDGKVVPFE